MIIIDRSLAFFFNDSLVYHFLSNISESELNSINSPYFFGFFADLDDDDFVMTLNQKKGEKEWQLPLVRQEFYGNKEMYSIRTLDSEGKERVSC